jgi:hypothetical protein
MWMIQEKLKRRKKATDEILVPHVTRQAILRKQFMYHITIQQRQHIISRKHTTLSGNDVVAVFPKSDTAKSSSGGGFSLKTSLPLVASSGSSGSLRLAEIKNTKEKVCYILQN